jgi:hypothetical protein
MVQAVQAKHTPFSGLVIKFHNFANHFWFPSTGFALFSTNTVKQNL